jgi:hypothetical protein
VKEHIPECPAGRDKYHLCICETLRMVRAAARRYEREQDKKENRDSRLNDARP